MIDVRQTIRISFKDLELPLFWRVRVAFMEVMQETLKVLDGIVYELRDQSRYVVKQRRAPVLFVEADGYWVSMQREKDREVRMMVSHEGWQPRTPGGEEYELVNKLHYLETNMRGEDFWDNASRHLCSVYDIDEKTLVVINGDRAKWIRKGVEYFPKAIYEVDRYHLKRELKDLLRDTRYLQNGLRAVDASDVDALTEVLRKVRREVQDPVRVAKINDLLAVIREMPEAFRDYRVRLEEMGYDTRGMRGIGATESNVNKSSGRLKKRGQSWSEAKRGGVWLLNVGTSRSGGLSKVLRRLTLPDPAIT